jgi:glycerol-3-phosphate dehydrogenase
MSKPRVIIVGAGFTGVAIAHDLALRGFDVSVIERGFIASGVSGRTHGVLHSGGRYAVKDHETATEMIEENLILRKIVPQAIEPGPGLFIAIDDRDMAYRDTFIEHCKACNISVKEISPKQALEIEPNLNPKLKTAVVVPDGSIDSLRMALAFAATAISNGAKFMLFTEVTDMITDGKGNIVGVKIRDIIKNRRSDLRAEIVVNAAGAWTGEIATMAGLDVPVKPTPGVMVGFDQRIVQRTINRLNVAGDGDIIQPQRQMVVVGTTSYEVTELDYVAINPDHVRLMLERGAELVPAIRNTHERGVYASTRPLIGKGKGRSAARTFKCFDHKENDNVDGLVTITGGNATITRVLAEKTSDVVCRKLGISAPCKTKELKLLSYRQFYTQHH